MLLHGFKGQNPHSRAWPPTNLTTLPVATWAFLPLPFMLASEAPFMSPPILLLPLLAHSYSFFTSQLKDYTSSEKLTSQI